MFVKIISYLYNYSSKTTYTDRGTKMAGENELKGAPTGGPDRTHAAQAVRALRRGTNPEGAQDKTGPQQLAAIAAAMSPNTNYKPDNIYTQLRTKLFYHGLLETQADAILDRVVQKNEAVRGRWNDPAGGYPAPKMRDLWLTTKTEALAWIVENAPRHWARGTLTDAPPAIPAAPDFPQKLWPVPTERGPR
jgi:hypothetical protein